MLLFELAVICSLAVYNSQTILAQFYLAKTYPEGAGNIYYFILFLVCVRVGEKCRRRYPEMDLIAACRNFSFIFALVSCRGHFVCNVYTFSDIFSDKRIKEICLVSDRRAVMKRTKLSRSIWLMTYIALNLATNNIIFTKPITQYHFFVQNKYFISYRIYFSYIIFKIFSYNHDDNNS